MVRSNLDESSGNPLPGEISRAGCYLRGYGSSAGGGFQVLVWQAPVREVWVDLFLWEAGRWTFSNPFQTCFPCVSVPVPSPVPPGALVA